MTTETTELRSLGAVMSSESGFEGDENDSPLRVSGFLSVILALLGGFTIVALPMVVFLIAAILMGIYALRKSDSKNVPVGTTAARIGILLAVLFTTWGVGKFSFKQNTIGGQAEYFARQFIRVASSGNEVYAKELQKSYVNRYLRSMPLEETYEMERLKLERQHREALERGDMSTPPIEEDDTTVADLVKYPVDHTWYLVRPVTVYNHYGRQMAEVVLASDETDKAFKLRVVLEYLIHKDTGSGEWYVETCLPFRERIVAESVL